MMKTIFMSRLTISSPGGITCEKVDKSSYLTFHDSLNKLTSRRSSINNGFLFFFGTQPIDLIRMWLLMEKASLARGTNKD